MPAPSTLLSRLADAILGATGRAAIMTADLGTMIAHGRVLPGPSGASKADGR